MTTLSYKTQREQHRIAITATIDTGKPKFTRTCKLYRNELYYILIVAIVFAPALLNFVQRRLILLLQPIYVSDIRNILYMVGLWNNHEIVASTGDWDAVWRPGGRGDPPPPAPAGPMIQKMDTAGGTTLTGWMKVPSLRDKGQLNSPKKLLCSQFSLQK